MEKSLCRICLNNVLGYALFDAEEGFSMISKLELCLHEQVLDRAGYPRIICQTCKEDLNTAYNFINKYKNTNIILENGFILNEYDKVVIEEELFNSCDDSEQSAIYKQPRIQKNKEDPHNILRLELIKYDDTAIKEELYYSSNDDNERTIEKQPTVQNIKEEAKTPNILTLVKSLSNSGNITVKKISKNCEVKKNNETLRLKNIKKTCQVKIERKQCSSTAKSGEKKQTKTSNVPCEDEPIPTLKHKKRAEKQLLLCDICAAVYKSSDSLKLHKETVHFPTNIKCDHCAKVFKSSSSLKRHNTNKHSIKTCVCHDCGMEFCYIFQLTHHIKRVHLKQKINYKCQYCKRSFASKTSATIHERSVHTGVRPVSCDVCGACFYHEIYLREHMRQHTGERPYKCPVCGRGHTTRCNMKSHVKTNHRISDIDPEVLANIRPFILKVLRP